MLPADQFHCLLDELPLHLIPRRQFMPSLRDPQGQPLFLNPQCLVLSAGEAPGELEGHRELLENFNLQGTVVWVRASSGSLQPFLLGARLQKVVSQLRTGEPVPSSVSREDRSCLAQAGILSSEDEAEHALAQWRVLVGKCAAQFRGKGYAPLANLIHPFHVAALRRYYRHAIRRGHIRLGDNQSARRYVAHNESVACFFHHQIAKTVSAIVGEAIKPSYVYLASYLSGAELKKHTDRAQCEFSVTLCLDFSPEPDVATSWPICLDAAGGTVKVFQALGDGLVYRGTTVPHYRGVLGERHTSTSIFFHYVAENFSGPLE